MPRERIDSFNIHHMVHAWARDRQTPGERRSNVEKVLVAIAIAADAVREPESRRRVFERQILPHIRQCLNYLAPASVSSVGYHYWSVLGSVCKHQDEYEDAEKLYKYAKEDLDGKPALENEKAMVLLQISSTSIARGKSAEAEGMSRHVLDRTVESDLRLLARINLASACKFQSRFHEAEQYLKDALYQCEDIFGPGNLRTLRLVDQLATMYQEHGVYEKAEWLLRREVLSFEAHVGSDLPERRMAEVKLVSVWVEQGKYEEGGALVERLLDNYERLLGSEHPKILRLVASLAVIYDLQGSFAESHPLYIRVLEGSQRTLGPNHTATLDVLENMALRCYMQGKYKEAEELLRNVLETRLSQRYDVEAIERVKARLAELHKQQGFKKKRLSKSQAQHSMDRDDGWYIRDKSDADHLGGCRLLYHTVKFGGW